MSVVYEPQPVNPPDLEAVVAAHLRSIVDAGVMVSRRFPETLPVTIASVEYTTAVVVRDDGGTWPNRTVSIGVVGARDADYQAVRALAVDVLASVSMLAAANLPIASVTAVRGPMSVAENPPEFQSTADLLVVG